jgi:hypothetical protein
LPVEAAVQTSHSDAYDATTQRGVGPVLPGAVPQGLAPAGARPLEPAITAPNPREEVALGMAPIPEIPADGVVVGRAAGLALAPGPHATGLGVPAAGPVVGVSGAGLQGPLPRVMEGSQNLEVRGVVEPGPSLLPSRSPRTAYAANGSTPGSSKQKTREIVPPSSTRNMAGGCMPTEFKTQVGWCMPAKFKLNTRR